MTQSTRSSPLHPVTPSPLRPAGLFRAAEFPLRAFYDRHYAPCFLAGVRPRTFTAYGESLNHWERITPDPPLRGITIETLAGFKAGLVEPPARTAGPPAEVQRLLFDGIFERELDYRPLAKTTANKHLRQVQAILGKAGMPGPRNRDALGILELVPWVKPYKVPRPRPRGVKADTLTAIYRAAAVARYPVLKGVVPGNWWKALIVIGLVDGFRRGGLLGLHWDDVDWEAMEIRLPAEEDKCREERVKPMNRVVVQHLLRIRTARPRIFEFPHSESTLYRQWWAIQDAAGLPEEDWIKLHDLKKTCGTILARAGSSPWAIQRQLDHSTLATSAYYVGADEAQRDAVERMPLPAAFYEDFLPPPSEAVG